jgi:flagellar hook-associated protein 1 FlgK
VEIRLSRTNILFFGETAVNGVAVDAISNGQIKINSNILNDPKNIAASEVANNDGNGGNANKIARLFDASFVELNSQSFMDYYSTTLNSLGTEKVNSDNSVESSTAILQQLKNENTSYSGVSLDEEMTNVLKYQRSYDAAAKMIKVADEMMQTILQMV